MKKLIFAMLIAVNVGLLLTLIAGSWSVQPARGQAVLGAGYVMMSARLDGDEDLIYLVNLKTNQMVGIKYDEQDEELQRFRGLTLIPRAERRGN
jgi:hypothetical protein